MPSPGACLALWLGAALLASGLLCGPATAQTEELSGRVVHVRDGDSLALLDAAKRVHEIRLDGIDAPELGQAYGRASKRNLQALTSRREALAMCHKTDRYGRAICRVTVSGADLGLQQIAAGMAWTFERFERELPAPLRQQYRDAQRQARERRLGLWGDAYPVPPWTWRDEHPRQARRTTGTGP